MKRIFPFIGIVIALIIIMPVIIGSFMAQEHTISRSQDFSSPQTVLWTTITDPKAQDWRRNIKQIETNDRVWTEIRANGSTNRYKVVAEDMPNRLIRRQEDSSFPKEWEFVIDPIDTGSRLTLTERTSINNPFLRFINRLSGTNGIRMYLDDLKKRLP